MDLKGYYKKLRETEATISAEHVVLVSLPTPEGGKAGQLTEATRAVAARLITEGRARLASDEEAAAFREEMREACERHERQEAARRMQVVVLPAEAATGSRPEKKRKES